MLEDNDGGRGGKQEDSDSISNHVMFFVDQVPLLATAYAHCTEHQEAIKDCLEDIQQLREDIITNSSQHTTFKFSGLN